MTTTEPHKPFSMIREFHLADWFTLANAVAAWGLFSTMTYLENGEVRHVYFASGWFWRLDFRRSGRSRRQMAAEGVDDGTRARLARRCHLVRVAPAIMAYGCGMQGLYDRIVLGYFVACGVSRLARYNVTAEALTRERTR